MSASKPAATAFHPAAGRFLCFGPFRFDRTNRLLNRGGIEVALPPRALGLLEHLVERPGTVVSKQALMAAIWADTVVTETSLTEAVSLVRQALGDDPQTPEFIQTVHRRGYRFVARVRADGEPAALRVVEPGVQTEAATRAWLWPRVPPWVAVLGLVAVSAAALAIWRGLGAPSREARPLRRFAVSLPPGDPLGPKAPSALALSPDGTRLVFAVSRSGRDWLYLRAMDRLEAVPIPGTEGGVSPFFSPDGRWLGFFADGKLKKLRLSGGEPVSICDSEPALGASWGGDGQIVFAAGWGSGLHRVAATGGVVESLSQPDAALGELGYYWPEVLPGGDAVVFTVWTAGGLAEARIDVLSLRTSTRKTLVRGATFGRYAVTGHLVFARMGTLAAAAFDTDALELTAPPVAVLDGVRASWFTGSAQFGLSREGTLAYVPGGYEVPAHSLVRLGRDGRERGLPLPARPFMNLAVAPGARRVAVTIHEGSGSDLWLADLQRRALNRLTFEAHNIEPCWTPDGSRVTFASSRAGPYNLFWVPADGSSAPERMLESARNQYPSSWSPDGRLLAFSELHPETGVDLWLLPLGEGNLPRPLLRTPFDEDMAAFSPDGRWFAYESNESGRREVSVRPYPELAPRYAVSTEGGYDPAWSPDGRELYYRNREQLLAVKVETGTELKLGHPRPLLETSRLVALRPADDGDWVAIVGEDQMPSPRSVVVVLEWFAELQRLSRGH